MDQKLQMKTRQKQFQSFAVEPELMKLRCGKEDYDPNEVLKKV